MHEVIRLAEYRVPERKSEVDGRFTSHERRLPSITDCLESDV